MVLPLLPSAYNLARWLTRNDHDADDVVQEAFLRAYRFFPSFRGGDARAWLLDDRPQRLLDLAAREPLAGGRVGLDEADEPVDGRGRPPRRTSSAARTARA